MTDSKTLINFHVPSDLLATFDRLCRLNGKPRSQILNDLLSSWVLETGRQLLSQIDEIRKIDQHLKSACEKGFDGRLADMLPQAGNTVQTRARLDF